MVSALASQDTSIMMLPLIDCQSMMDLKIVNPLSTVSARQGLHEHPQARARQLQTLIALNSARLYQRV